MKKDLIVGAFCNYPFEVLKPWIFSIKESGFSGDIILIAIDSKEQTIQQIEACGVKTIGVKKSGKMMIHMLRFLHIYNYLKQYNNKYRYVITTDVRDVIFQKNPSEWLDVHCKEGVVAQSESIRIKDEKWNRENIIKNFGADFYEDVKNNEVYNVGILAGEASFVKDLCFSLFQMSLNRPDWVADQAAYNMLLSFKPWSLVTYKATLADAWAINAHVTNKPDQLNEFGPFLLEGRPYMEEGIVKNAEGKIFVIVHQYDRVPEWMDFYMKKFDFLITSKTNTGSSPKYFKI